MYLVIILLKIIGVIVFINWPIPQRFPPEVISLKIGYEVYLFIEKLFLFLNLKIKLFPSFLVTFIQELPVKFILVKFPVIFIDLCIICIIFFLHKYKNKKYIVFFALINCWLFSLIMIERLDFINKIFLFFIKPYKIGPDEHNIYLIFLLIIFFSLLSLFGKLSSYLKMFKKVFLNILNIKVIVKIIFSGLCIFFVFQSGILLRTNKQDFNFKGFWIWADGWREKENNHITFEKSFNLFFKPKKAIVNSYCESEYLLWINGVYVGRGGIESPNGILYYDNFSVEKFLKKGENNISIECRNNYLDTLSMIKRKGGMIFQLEADNGIFKKKIISDKSWRVFVDERYVQNTNRVSQSVGFQQVFTNGNLKTILKTQTIDNAKDYFKGKYQLMPIPFPQGKAVFPEKISSFGKFIENNNVKSEDLAVKLGEGSKISSINLTKSAGEDFIKGKLIFLNNDFAVLDFGKIVVGYSVIEGVFNKDVIIEIGFAETLKPDGTVDIAKMVSQADKIIISDENLYYEWFERRAFRYAFMTVKNISGKAELQKFYVNSVNYPFDGSEGFFITSDKELNKIFEIAKYTALLASQQNFEDCPHRERAQYVGDTRIVSLVNYFNYSDQRLIKKALWEFALSQNEEGDINAVYPSGRKLNIPDYSTQWISAVWEYYLYSNDLVFLKQIQPYLQKELQYFSQFADDDSLIHGQIKWWTFIDQGDQELSTDKSISFNLFYLEAIRNYVKICNELLMPEEAKKYSDLAEKIIISINSEAFVDKENLYDDCLINKENCNNFSRQTNVLALREKIIPLSKEKMLVSKLQNSATLPTVLTPYFNFFIADAYFSNGYSKEAIKLVKEYWGAMVRKGASTFWETYDPKTGKESTRFGESLSHGWSSGPAYLMPKWIIGITSIKPAFEEFVFKPCFDCVSMANLTIPVKDKKIKAEFDLSKGPKISLEYDFPAKATVILPLINKKKLYFNNKAVDIENNVYNITLKEPGSYAFIYR